MAQHGPQLEWEDVRLFLAVAERGSFSAAGRALGIEQSTVSRRIAQFEARLAIGLFERRANGARLTAFGEKLLVRARAMAREVQGLEDDLSHHEREVRGEVRLALTESIAVHAVVPFVLPALLERYPELRVSLLTSYEVADLGHREAELALRFFRPTTGDLVSQCVAKMQTIWMGHERWIGVAANARVRGRTD